MKKILLGIAIVLLLAIGGGVWWVYSSLDSLVASAIRTYAPEILGVSIKLSGVTIKPADGSASLRGLVIGNPKGFKTAHALSLGEIAMTLDINSLTKDVILIKQISVIKPDVIYEKGSGGTNLDAIQHNVDSYVAAHGGGKGEAKDQGPGKKFIIENFYLKDGKATVTAEILQGKELSVPIPDLHLTDIGKRSNGATAGEAAKQIVGALTQSVTKASTAALAGAVEGVKKNIEGATGKFKGLLGR